MTNINNLFSHSEMILIITISTQMALSHYFLAPLK